MDIETDNSKTLLIALARISEIEAENARLRAEIDAANAQEPKESVSPSNKSIIESLIESARCMGAMIEDNGAHKYWSEKVEEYRAKAYLILDSANPIPAQQSPAASVPFQSGDLVKCDSKDDFRVVARADYVDMFLEIKADDGDEFNYTLSFDDVVASYRKVGITSPRITEQDADKNDPIFTFVAQHYPLTAEHVESIYRECVRLIESRYSPN